MSAMGINPMEMPVNPVYHNITTTASHVVGGVTVVNNKHCYSSRTATAPARRDGGIMMMEEWFFANVRNLNFVHVPSESLYYYDENEPTSRLLRASQRFGSRLLRVNQLLTPFTQQKTMEQQQAWLSCQLVFIAWQVKGKIITNGWETSVLSL